MARALRFHLDESCDPRIAVALRLRGIEVTTAGEVGLLGASDDQQMEFAHNERRTILTHDADFLRFMPPAPNTQASSTVLRKLGH